MCEQRGNSRRKKTFVRRFTALALFEQSRYADPALADETGPSLDATPYPQMPTSSVTTASPISSLSHVASAHVIYL